MDDLIAERIRALDDHLRKNPTADIAIMTPGIAALGRDASDRIVKIVTQMTDICHEYRPDEDQHTGSFPFERQLISFKIDHYERPGRPAGQNGRTDRVRVITVTLAGEN
jgi:hypothetical protein